MSDREVDFGTVDSGDSVRSRLSSSQRMSFWNNTFILWGLVLVITSLLVGGVVGTQLTFRDAIIVILLASAFNCLVSIFVGLIGTKTGYTSAMIFRFSYGKLGVLLPNFIMSLTTVLWFAVILNLTRDAFVDMVNITLDDAFLYWGVTFLMAFLFVLPAYKTIKWIAYVDYLAVPAIVLILAITIWSSIDAGGGIKQVIQQAPVVSSSIFLVFTSAAGGWLHSNTMMSDFTRFYKNENQAIIGIILTFGVMMVFQYIGATIGALATGEWNIFLILENFGLLEVTFIALFLGSMSTGMAAIYFAANLMAAPPIPEYENEEKTRKLVLIIAWIIALFFSWYGPDKVFNFFLQFLAWLVGPIAMTVICDFWFLKRRREIYLSPSGVPDMNVNPAAYLAWIVGFFTGYFTQGFYFSLLNGMLATAVVYYGWMYYAMKYNTTPEKQMKLVKNK